MEIQVIDGLVNFIGRSVVWSSSIVRYAQAGSTGFYIFAMVLSIVLMLVFKLVL
jgi:hypothetical protein